MTLHKLIIFRLFYLVIKYLPLPRKLKITSQNYESSQSVKCYCHSSLSDMLILFREFSGYYELWKLPYRQ